MSPVTASGPRIPTSGGTKTEMTCDEIRALTIKANQTYIQSMTRTYIAIVNPKRMEELEQAAYIDEIAHKLVELHKRVSKDFQNRNMDVCTRPITFTAMRRSVSTWKPSILLPFLTALRSMKEGKFTPEQVEMLKAKLSSPISYSAQHFKA